MAQTWQVYPMLVLFWAMQLGAAYFFKWGGGEGRWWWGFWLGNALGMPSTFLIIYCYKHIPNTAVAAALLAGITYMIVQVSMAIIFKAALSPLQFAGISAIVLGVMLLAAGTR
jgi:multidrug transporter EmrE-like cation transporter